MKTVFISYRRDDSKYQARRIYDALLNVLPASHVFMDVGSLKVGDDFVEVLEGWVAKCDVLLALIGAHWLDAKDARTGKRRLDDENDLVRIEVREALKRGIKVVPVVLDGARMPDNLELPADLQKLARRNAEFVEFRTFDTDVDRLIYRLNLREMPAKSPVKPKVQAEQAGAAGFRDFAQGPEMVELPAGYFIMGSPPDEPGRSKDEGPRHEIVIPRPFAIGRYPVTRGEFAAFTEASGYNPKGGAYAWNGAVWALNSWTSWQNPGFEQDDTHPVVCVNSHDIERYLAWLNSFVTAHVYRLPSEAEWEYACRAGTATPFFWGSSITADQANYNSNHVYRIGGGRGIFRGGTVPVHSFEPNPWGLYQMHGNVWERCEDVWNENSYREKPFALNETGGALITGDRDHRVVRGGSWESNPARLRAAFRNRGSLKNRYSDRGFRVARVPKA